ncbi:MAG: LysE family translocator [Pseudomonadota bacterium]|nr:LysE family translocator [Pseudomonadota bacterium]
MSLALYGAFVAAVVALLLIPGPNVTLIVANAVARGPRAGLATVAGTWAAMVPQLIVTALGMGALLAGAAQALGWLRWLGVAYLVWLAWRAFTAPADDSGAAGPDRKPLRALFARGFLVSLANPKTLAFYAAFFPQFLDSHAPIAPQLVLLCATFLALAAIVDCGWALLAARLGAALRISARVRNTLTGALLLGAGLGLGLMRRA